MIFQHHRFQIWNKSQHPYSHSLTEFTYVNDALPAGEVQNAKQAMDWILAVIYPNQQAAVDTPGDLPVAGNAINDYRVVNDDGDGKAASYRWEQREGDVAPLWYKIYDMDWGEASILSNFLNKTQDIYVYKYGIDDLDSSGSAFAGDLAGQRVYGGESAGSHLILYANSGDGVGAGTGFIQYGDNSRPLVDSTFSLGTAAYRFLNFWTDEANVSTLRILGGSITDTTGEIDFADENLSTTGTVTVDTLLLQGGSITDTTGLIDFDDENLTTTGLVTADGGVDVGTTHIRTGGIFITEAASGHDFTFTPDSGASTFTGTLSVTGDFDAANGSFKNTISTLSPSETDDLLITVQDADYALYDSSTVGHRFITGAVSSLQLSDTLIDNLILTAFRDDVDFWDGATNYLQISPNKIDALGTTLTIDAGVTLTLEAVANVRSRASISPLVDDLVDLGLVGARWEDLYLSNSISDGTDAISVATLLSFRDANVGVADGMTLFWSTDRWVASLPDTEIDHGAISGLSGDDHLQYALLIGRSGGQTLIGGIDASDDLVLESTSNGTKGNIVYSSTFLPSGDDTLDIGSGSNRVADLYMAGEGIGFRMENAANVGALPAASALNVGRLGWVIDTENIYVDRGGTWKQITSDKYTNDDAVTWDGTNVTQTYTTSGDIDDARLAVWQFLDNTNGFREVNGAVITKTQTQVTVTFTIPPASGTYRLVGVG